MKQKDIALIVGVAGVSLIIAIVLSNMIFSSSGAGKQQAEVVQPISSAFVQPNKKYFNENSIDPTEVISIGNSNNQAPFVESSGQ